MSGKLVIQTDFGLQDGAVNAMYGVAYQVDAALSITDLTHEITPFDIHDASYRLLQSVSYWPKETVFVSVVDPGVGSKRRSVVALLTSGQYIITPDNGTLTYVKNAIGIKEVREINEETQRLAGSSDSHTFHGRDVYMYNGARLASKKITFENLGTLVSPESISTFPLNPPTQKETLIEGTIDILDIRFGSLWTNIPLDFFKNWNVQYGDTFQVDIYEKEVLRYQQRVTFGRSFAQVKPHEPVLYINSLLNIGLGLNLGSFASTYHIETGTDWKIIIKKENLS